MKSILVGLAFLFLYYSTSFSQENTITGKVISVQDGDNFNLLTTDNRTITIRLNGIDAPELKQSYGDKSRQNLSDKILNQSVICSVTGKDNYGRTIADVFLEDGTNVNYFQALSGYAWHFKKYSNDETLSNFEQLAKQQKKGLWIDNNAIAPWDYRASLNKSSDDTIVTKSSNSEKQCKAITQKGTQCKRKAEAGSDYCWQHQNYNTTQTKKIEKSENTPVSSGRCQAITKKGKQCSRQAQPGSKYCWQHNK